MVPLEQQSTLSRLLLDAGVVEASQASDLDTRGVPGELDFAMIVGGGFIESASELPPFGLAIAATIGVSDMLVKTKATMQNPTKSLKWCGESATNAFFGIGAS
jgi:hypothetical protein